VRVRLEGLTSAAMWDSLGSEKQAAPALTFTVGPDQVEKRRIYVRAPAAGAEHYQLKLVAQDRDHTTVTKTVRFERPEEGQ
jgi:hypothetical protein